jgi:glycosyltransferase involved in cell wall biosynthesis
VKPKVAYIVSRYPHLPETFILREMNELVEQGFSVELFPLVMQRQSLVHPEAAHWLDELHHVRFFSWKCIRANLRMMFRRPCRYCAIFFQMLWFNLSSVRFLLRALFIFPVAVEMAEEMQALEIGHIHAHYATHPALAAWIIWRFTGIPYSISVHAHDIFVNRTMLKQKLDGAVFIRAISQFNKAFLVHLYGAQVEQKIQVIHCGISTDRYTHKQNPVSSDFQIINIGSLQPYKGQAHLVEACTMLKEQGFPFHCRIVGGGELQSALAKQIEQLGLSACVELVGPKTENEVTLLLAGSDCFVLPSVVTPSGKMEGIPVVLMEALASNIAVIASDISGIPELVRDQVSGLLVPPGDVDAIVRQIVWLQAHPKEAVKMAAAGRKLVESEFNISINTLELANLFIQFQYKKKVTAGEK